MTDPEKTLPLAADFPPATREEWRKLVDAVLKGAPFERLVSTTYDGLSIEPLAARRSDARPIAARPGATAWEVLARIDQPDPALANEAALRELANGASGLSLVFAGAVGDYGFGLPAREGALARVLEGVDLTGGLAIELDLSPHAEAVIGGADKPLEWRALERGVDQSAPFIARRRGKIGGERQGFFRVRHRRKMPRMATRANRSGRAIGVPFRFRFA